MHSVYKPYDCNNKEFIILARIAKHIKNNVFCLLYGPCGSKTKKDCLSSFDYQTLAIFLLICLNKSDEIAPQSCNLLRIKILELFLFTGQILNAIQLKAISL